MSWVLIACIMMADGICGRVLQVPYETLEVCNEQRDALARQRGVTYAYCRGAWPVEIAR